MDLVEARLQIWRLYYWWNGGKRGLLLKVKIKKFHGSFATLCENFLVHWKVDYANIPF
jgi:hypothetical protein